MSMHSEAATIGSLAVPDAETVAALPRRTVDAWEANYPDASAAVFTEERSMIPSGVFRKGRSQIRTFQNSPRDAG